MTYWGGASPGSNKCACGMTNLCADSSKMCNCDKNDPVWREDSGLLTDKTQLPVKKLRFGDSATALGGHDEKGYHTLGKLKCYGIASFISSDSEYFVDKTMRRTRNFSSFAVRLTRI